MKKALAGISLGLVCLLFISAVLSCAGQPTIQIKQQIIPVKRGDLVITVSADGNLALPEQRELTFANSGTVKEVLVKEGDSVKEGQVLARLDTVDLERAVVAEGQAVKSKELEVQSLEIDLVQYGQDAQAAIKNAEIELEKATDAYRQITYPYTYTTFAVDIPDALGTITQVEIALNDLKTMIADGLDAGEIDAALQALKKALDDLALARGKLARGTGSVVFGDPASGGVFPVTDYWTLTAAQRTMEQAEVALTKLKDDIVTGTQKAEVALASARVNLQTAQNRLDNARSELDKAEIKAPYDGVVVDVPVKTGDVIVNYASTTVVKLVNPVRMEIQAKVDEIDIPVVKLGQSGVIRVDALPELEMKGEVTFISLLSQQESGLVVYRVKVAFDVPDGAPIKEGMTATVDITTNERKSVLLVPDRAIFENSQGVSVVKVMVNGQVEEWQVTPGLSDGVQTEILEGLSEGDQVVEEIRVQTQSPGLFGG